MVSSAFTIGDRLRTHATERPNDVLLVDAGNDRTLTYGEVYGRVRRLASALHELGVRKGDRVGAISVDNYRFAELLLATMSMGATIVPINPRAVRREVETFLAKSEARLLFADARSLENVHDIADVLGCIGAIVAFDPDSPLRPEPGGADFSYDALLAEAPNGHEWPDIEDSDILRLSFTSGTTGTPKGVLQSHLMLKRLAIQCSIDREFTRRTFHYNGSPLFHVSGFSHLLAAVAVGFRILLMPAFKPSELLDWLSDGGLTDVFLVPTMVSSLLTTPDIEGRDYSQVRSFGYGAAPMPPALLRRAMDVFGCDFLQLFGASECGSQTVLGWEEHRRAVAGEHWLLASIGKAAFDTEVRLCDDDMNDVPPGEIGEIVSRGDVNMSGYMDLPVETARVMIDGWFRSGDMARRDDDGYLYLMGRKKDLLIRGGENIYPIDIESVLFEFPGVREAAVVGYPDEHWGEIVMAYLVVDWPEDREEDLLAFCRTHLAPQKIPVRLAYLDTLPKTSTGKIDKVAIRSILHEDRKESS